MSHLSSWIIENVSDADDDVGDDDDEDYDKIDDSDDSHDHDDHENSSKTVVLVFMNVCLWRFHKFIEWE